MIYCRSKQSREEAEKITGNKVKVNVRIPQKTYDWIIGNNYTVTEAVNEALIRLFYKKARFVNLRLEDHRILDRLNEIENDFIQIATTRNQKTDCNNRIIADSCALRHIGKNRSSS